MNLTNFVLSNVKKPFRMGCMSYIFLSVLAFTLFFGFAMGGPSIKHYLIVAVLAGITFYLGNIDSSESKKKIKKIKSKMWDSYNLDTPEKIAHGRYVVNTTLGTVVPDDKLQEALDSMRAQSAPAAMSHQDKRFSVSYNNNMSSEKFIDLGLVYLWPTGFNSYLCMLDIKTGVLVYGYINSSGATLVSAKTAKKEDKEWMKRIERDYTNSLIQRQTLAIQHNTDAINDAVKYGRYYY